MPSSSPSSRTVRKLHGRHVLALARKRTILDLVGRLGITVTKKVGNAVVRNRIKRMLREWLRLTRLGSTGWDMVLVAKDSAARQVHPDDFAPDLSKILRQLSTDHARARLASTPLWSGSCCCPWRCIAACCRR